MVLYIVMNILPMGNLVLILKMIRKDAKLKSKSNIQNLNFRSRASTRGNLCDIAYVPGP